MFHSDFLNFPIATFATVFTYSCLYIPYLYCLSVAEVQNFWFCRNTPILFFVLSWRVSLFLKWWSSPPRPQTDMQVFVAPLLLKENSFCSQFCMHSKTFWVQGGGCDGCGLDQSLFWAQVLVLSSYSDWVVVTNPWIIYVSPVLSRAIWITSSSFP